MIWAVSSARQRKRRIAADFDQRRLLADDDRAAAGHRFERRQAETFVERGKHQRERMFVQGAQLGIGNKAHHAHAVGLDLVDLAEYLGVLGAGQHQHGVVELGLMEGRDDAGDVLVRGVDADAEKKFAADQIEPSQHGKVGRNRGDVVAALVADRHFGDIGAVPFADFVARKFRDRDHQIGAPAQARQQKAVGGAKARRKIIRQRAHGGVVHDHDLMARHQRPEHAQIEQQAPAACSGNSNCSQA